MRTLRIVRVLGVAAATALTACNISPSSSSLTVRGSMASGTTASRLHFASSVLSSKGTGPLGPGQMLGNPGSLQINMYTLYISQSADCSNPLTVQDYGSSPVAKDFVLAPTLFTGSPAAGSYNCIAVKMSDLLQMRPATTFGACDSTVTYPESIYNTNNTNPADTASFMRDINLQPIAPLGTNSNPTAEPVLILFTMDTAAAYTRGFTHGQVIPLGAALTVPSTATFVWGGANTVLSDSASATCNVNPGQPTFQ